MIGAPLQVDDGEVGVVAGGDAALGGHAEQALRAGTGQVDEALQRQPPGIDVVEHDRHQGLDAGHPGRRSRIGLSLLAERVRRMVGAEHVDDAVGHALPDAFAVARLAYRRVHLDERAEACIVLGRQRQMVRSGLAAGDILVAGEKGDLLCRRDVEHMNAGAKPPGDADQPLGGGQRRRLVAPDRVRRRVAGKALTEPGAQTVLVLGMEGSAAPRAGQDGGHARIVLDQKVAGRRSHEDLDARRPGQPLQLAELGRVVARAADPEREVAMHAAGGARKLVGQRLGAGGERPGVRHLEHRCHAAEDGRAGAALQILLVLQAGLAEMDLAVDHARQDVKAAAIDPLAGGSLSERPDAGDAAADDADVAKARAVLVDDGAACQDDVEGGCHGAPRGLPLSCRRLT